MARVIWGKLVKKQILYGEGGSVLLPSLFAVLEQAGIERYRFFPFQVDQARPGGNEGRKVVNQHGIPYGLPAGQEQRLQFRMDKRG